MEGTVDSQDPIFSADDIDFGSTLQDFSVDFDFDLDLWLSNPRLVEQDLNSSKESENPESLSSFADEIEKLLMENGDEVLGEDGDKRVDEFLSDLLVDGSGSDFGKSEVASPESAGSVESEAAEEREEEEDEQTRKKCRRKMRNRESAMQSRGRKKMYVNELEMKSKYLELECRRLDYALCCCQAENFALHQHLQKGGALVAKQESAMLFVESLLLGSLFWLVSIAFPFPVPRLQTRNPTGASGLGRGLALGGRRVQNSSE